MRRLRLLLDPVWSTSAADGVVNALVRLWSGAVARRRDPRDALRALLALQDELFRRVDVLAVDLDRGVHAKHRIMRYHDFFVDRVHEGETVLDVGCGKAELAHDLVRAGAHVTAIEINREALAFARAHFASDRLELVEADARTWEPGRTFDVVVLSNVLEHIEDRVGLLRRLVAVAQPSRLLIRVPVLERDWSVGLRRELGLFYFSDPTHYTEYDGRQLTAELAAAGLAPIEIEQRWGELWTVAATTFDESGSRERRS
jgi:2-polyprenyl-3-methyl-5-hydroxy-6-metoxy-1,4-benzoquinol methylase